MVPLLGTSRFCLTWSEGVLRKTHVVWTSANLIVLIWMRATPKHVIWQENVPMHLLRLWQSIRGTFWTKTRQTSLLQRMSTKTSKTKISKKILKLSWVLFFILFFNYFLITSHRWIYAMFAQRCPLAFWTRQCQTSDVSDLSFFLRVLFACDVIGLFHEWTLCRTQYNSLLYDDVCALHDIWDRHSFWISHCTHRICACFCSKNSISVILCCYRY